MSAPWSAAWPSGPRCAAAARRPRRVAGGRSELPLPARRQRGAPHAVGRRERRTMPTGPRRRRPPPQPPPPAGELGLRVVRRLGRSGLARSAPREQPRKSDDSTTSSALNFAPPPPASAEAWEAQGELTYAARAAPKPARRRAAPPASSTFVARAPPPAPPAPRPPGGGQRHRRTSRSAQAGDAEGARASRPSRSACARAVDEPDRGATRPPRGHRCGRAASRAAANPESNGDALAAATGIVPGSGVAAAASSTRRACASRIKFEVREARADARADGGSCSRARRATRGGQPAAAAPAVARSALPQWLYAAASRPRFAASSAARRRASSSASPPSRPPPGAPPPRPSAAARAARRCGGADPRAGPRAAEATCGRRAVGGAARGGGSAAAARAAVGSFVERSARCDSTLLSFASARVTVAPLDQLSMRGRFGLLQRAADPPGRGWASRRRRQRRGRCEQRRGRERDGKALTASSGTSGGLGRPGVGEGYRRARRRLGRRHAERRLATARPRRHAGDGRLRRRPLRVARGSRRLGWSWLARVHLPADARPGRRLGCRSTISRCRERRLAASPPPHRTRKFPRRHGEGGQFAQPMPGQPAAARRRRGSSAPQPGSAPPPASADIFKPPIAARGRHRGSPLTACRPHHAQRHLPSSCKTRRQIAMTSRATSCGQRSGGRSLPFDCCIERSCSTMRGLPCCRRRGRRRSAHRVASSLRCRRRRRAAATAAAAAAAAAGRAAPPRPGRAACATSSTAPPPRSFAARDPARRRGITLMMSVPPPPTTRVILLAAALSHLLFGAAASRAPRSRARGGLTTRAGRRALVSIDARGRGRRTRLKSSQASATRRSDRRSSTLVV